MNPFLTRLQSACSLQEQFPISQRSCRIYVAIMKEREREMVLGFLDSFSRAASIRFQEHVSSVSLASLKVKTYSKSMKQKSCTERDFKSFNPHRKRLSFSPLTYNCIGIGQSDSLVLVLVKCRLLIKNWRTPGNWHFFGQCA